MIDSWPNGNATAATMLFPNWKMVYAGSFDMWMCAAVDGCNWVPTENLTGLTLVNFGTAGPTDITNVQWKVRCSSVNSGFFPMTFAGLYTEDSGPYNAWTWKGSGPDVSGCADLCGAPACGAYFTIDIYIDITPCPGNMETVSMGFPTSGGFGSITDNADCIVPWYDMGSDLSTIAWAYKKSNQTTIVPGETIMYTIFYGKPGTNPLTSIQIVDSQPPYTHYVVGSGNAPDIGYDPLIGPPDILRWTINPVPGNVPAWGPTNEIRFALSVDWGNGEGFEPGSGDVAAPEGLRLNNTAQVFFNGISAGCPGSAVNPPVSTVVKRFWFWSLGDNDILFSPTYGQPPDEMIYSIFIKNLSTTKTWWDVHMWDTVPADLDVWAPDTGLEDPCAGWTMTPTGCAAATPGVVKTGGNTIITWRLDMPPQMTLQLRWKAKVSPVAQARGTVVNIVSVLEYGRSGIANGTGYSGQPRNFAHLAPIVLPTMYTSYVGYGMGAANCPGYFLFFEPLNKKTQFELRGLYYVGAGWANAGGVSASIGDYWGSCLTGFPLGGIAGCKAERVPALFDPTNVADPSAIMGLQTRQCPALIFPLHWIHKLTSNAPTLWQCLTYCTSHDQDNHTYAPATTLSYTGLMHYMWKRYAGPEWSNGWGDGLSLINTSMDPYGVHIPTLDTSVYLFKWDYGTLSWDIWATYDLAPESQAYDTTTALADVGPYRSVSSQGQLIINQGLLTNPQLNQGGHSDNEAAFFPTRETGNVVSKPGQTANFYGIHQSAAQANKVVIGNLGVADAVYRVWRYIPDNLVPTPPMCAYLNGTSGTWQLQGTHTAPAGIAAANNPRIYPLDGAFFNVGTSSLVLSKVELISGGPIQVLAGIRVYSLWSGGAVMHAADGNQTGIEYWLHYRLDEGSADKSGVRDIYSIDVFCPKKGMVVNMTSGAGLTTSFTTTGPDQCVAFLQIAQWPVTPPYNYKITVLPNAFQGNVVTQFIAETGSEKGYTAPFLQEGVHYEFIAPPVVFSGQTFWITVIVKDTSGTTKTDYCGTTSFTSTDPAAAIGGTGMDLYNFTWSSKAACTSAPDEDGIKIFLGVTLVRMGMQTIVGMDTGDGSVNGLTAILVVAADVKLQKTPKLTVAASGDTVQFKVCWSNFSSGSAFTFVITDALPVGTTFVPEASTAALSCGNTNGLNLTVAYTTAASATMPPAASFTTGNPIAGTRWLRWTVPYTGVNTTGCGCYRITIN
ncbi:MAG: hypothetical protein AAB152_05175 [Candidatus Coatesbacteria bacterium]